MKDKSKQTKPDLVPPLSPSGCSAGRKELRVNSFAAGCSSILSSAQRAAIRYSECSLKNGHVLLTHSPRCEVAMQALSVVAEKATAGLTTSRLANSWPEEVTMNAHDTS